MLVSRTALRSLNTVFRFVCSRQSSETTPKSPERASSRNEEQRYVSLPESNHVNSRGQNGETGIHYVQATEVRSFPENKHRDPIQVMKG